MNHPSPLRHYRNQLVRFGVLCLIASPFMSAQTSNTLLPKPAQMTVATGSIPFTGNFTVSLGGTHNPILEAATRRTLDALELSTGIPLGKEMQAPDATLTIQVQDPSGTRPTRLATPPCSSSLPGCIKFARESR